MTAVASKLLPLVALLPCFAGAQDPAEIVRRAVETDTLNQETARNYTFLQRQEERQFDGSGKQKQYQLRTWDVTLLEGSPYRRLVARNDQPLSPAEQQNEEEKLRSNIEQRRKETPQQRERRLAEWHRRQQRQREPMREMVDAFNLRLVGEETLNGGQAWIIDATPKPGYKPKLASAAYFPKITARLWISEGDYNWIKIDARTLDTISFGGFILRLGKGAHLAIEQTRVNNEVWLPKHVSVDFNARLALIKGLRASLDVVFSDYKKFQAESRITSIEEKP